MNDPEFFLVHLITSEIVPVRGQPVDPTSDWLRYEHEGRRQAFNKAHVVQVIQITEAVYETWVRRARWYRFPREPVQLQAWNVTP